MSGLVNSLMIKLIWGLGPLDRNSRLLSVFLWIMYVPFEFFNCLTCIPFELRSGDYLIRMHIRLAASSLVSCENRDVYIV